MTLKRRKKSDGPLPPRSRKPASSRPAPELFPILDGVGAAPRFFPGELLDNQHCIDTFGRGLANIAELGGLGPEEIARNLRRLARHDPLSPEEAEKIVAEARVAWWKRA